MNQFCYGVVADRLNLNVEEFKRGLELGAFPADIVSEYGARICYNSIGKMYSNPGFAYKLVDAGHMDVFEHGHVTLMVDRDAVDGMRPFQSWFSNNKYASMYGNDGVVYFTASLRVWHSMVNVLPYEILLLLSKYTRLFDSMVETPLRDIEDANALQYPTYGEHFYENSHETSFGATVDLIKLHLPVPEHVPVPEAVFATFLVRGISRACSHQFVRHRLLSFSQMSQRYVDAMFGENIDVDTIEFLDTVRNNIVIPPSVIAHGRENEFVATAANSYRTYVQLRKAGLRKEDARFLLPNATKTDLVVTGNLFAWNHFLSLRDAKDAQWEIREVASAIGKFLTEYVSWYVWYNA